MEEQVIQPVESQGPPEPPRGAQELTLDDKTRLKLPASFHRYLTAKNDKLVFITTLDLRTARIYPLSVWKRNEQMLAAFCDDPEAKETLEFITQRFGGDSDVDSSGRLVLPQQLRDRLGFQPKAKVWLVYQDEAFALYTDAEFQARSTRLEERLTGAVGTMKRAGFK